MIIVGYCNDHTEEDNDSIKVPYDNDDHTDE